jgi:4a-hydroxytetrahydrobiopterin dehydratase
MISDGITARAFHQAAGTEDWRVVGDGACAFFGTRSLRESARLVAAIGEISGADDHAPDLDVRSRGVTVRLLTRSEEWYGMSQRDVELARAISSAAHELGLAADPAEVQSMLIVPGARDTSEVMPFWQAALGYDRRPDSPDEDLVDPRDRLPAFWFEEMQEPRGGEGGGAIHVAVWLPLERAEARVRAALAAGGHVVRDDRAPMWWTLADAAGNEVDISTVENRD